MQTEYSLSRHVCWFLVEMKCRLRRKTNPTSIYSFRFIHSHSMSKTFDIAEILFISIKFQFTTTT